MNKKARFIHTDLEQKELVFGKESIANKLLINKRNVYGDEIE